MPPIETAMRHQKAVYWEADGFDLFGNYKVKPGVEIDVRWKWTNDKMIDAQGNNVSVDAHVVVAQRIQIGSLMWLGELADLPDPLRDLCIVKTYRETGDVRQKVLRRTLQLQRYHDTFPEIS